MFCCEISDHQEWVGNSLPTVLKIYVAQVKNRIKNRNSVRPKNKHTYWLLQLQTRTYFPAHVWFECVSWSRERVGLVGWQVSSKHKQYPVLEHSAPRRVSMIECTDCSVSLAKHINIAKLHCDHCPDVEPNHSILQLHQVAGFLNTTWLNILPTHSNLPNKSRAKLRSGLRSKSSITSAFDSLALIFGHLPKICCVEKKVESKTQYSETQKKNT